MFENGSLMRRKINFCKLMKAVGASKTIPTITASDPGTSSTPQTPNCPSRSDTREMNPHPISGLSSSSVKRLDALSADDVMRAGDLSITEATPWPHQSLDEPIHTRVASSIVMMDTSAQASSQEINGILTEHSNAPVYADPSDANVHPPLTEMVLNWGSQTKPCHLTRREKAADQPRRFSGEENSFKFYSPTAESMGTWETVHGSRNRTYTPAQDASLYCSPYSPTATMSRKDPYSGYQIAPLPQHRGTTAGGIGSAFYDPASTSSINVTAASPHDIRKVDSGVCLYSTAFQQCERCTTLPSEYHHHQGYPGVYINGPPSALLRSHTWEMTPGTSSSMENGSYLEAQGSSPTSHNTYSPYRLGDMMGHMTIPRPQPPIWSTHTRWDCGYEQRVCLSEPHANHQPRIDGNLGGDHSGYYCHHAYPPKDLQANREAGQLSLSHPETDTSHISRPDP